MKYFKHLFAFCLVSVFTVSCSQQSEPLAPKTKESYLPAAQQAKIKKAAVAMFASFDKKMLAAQGNKSDNVIDDVLADPNTFLHAFLEDEVASENPQEYKDFVNTEEGQLFVTPNFENETTFDLNEVSSSVAFSLDIYFQDVESALNGIANENGIVDVVAASKVLHEVTLKYEDTVLNDETLTEDDKFYIFVATTHILADSSNLVALAGNLSNIDAAKGKFWKGLKAVVKAFVRVTVSVVQHVGRSIIAGARIGVKLCNGKCDSFSAISTCACKLGSGTIGGAIGLPVGIVRAIWNASKNKCLNGKGQYVPCLQ